MTGRLATIARAGRWRGARWFGLKGAPAAPAAAGRDKVGRNVNSIATRALPLSSCILVHCPDMAYY